MNGMSPVLVSNASTRYRGHRREPIFFEDGNQGIYRKRPTLPS
jgi:hypothetical protein